MSKTEQAKPEPAEGPAYTKGWIAVGIAGGAMVATGMIGGIVMAPHLMERVSAYSEAYENHKPASELQSLRDERFGAVALELGCGAIDIYGSAMIGIALSTRREDEPTAMPVTAVPRPPA